jgi:hypothetical protein
MKPKKRLNLQCFQTKREKDLIDIDYTNNKNFCSSI